MARNIIRVIRGKAAGGERNRETQRHMGKGGGRVGWEHVGGPLGLEPHRAVM